MGDRYSIVCKDKLDRILILDWNVDSGLTDKKYAMYSLNKLRVKSIDRTYDEMMSSKSDIHSAFMYMYKDKLELLGTEYHLFNAYRNAFELCKEKVKKYKIKSNILFGDFEESEINPEIKIVKFTFIGKQHKLEIKSNSEQVKVLELYNDIIIRLFKYDTSILTKLEKMGYCSNVLNTNIYNKEVEYQISHLMFGKANFGKYCIYKKGSNIELESKRFITFKGLSTKIESSSLINDYRLSVEALNRYNDILNHISLQELSSATSIKLDFLEDRILNLKRKVNNYSVIVNDILDNSIEDKNIQEYINIDLGVNYNDDSELEFTYEYVAFTLYDIYELTRMIKDLAIQKVKKHKDSERIIELIQKNPCPIVEDTKISLIYDDIKDDIKNNRIAAVELNKKKVYNRLAEAIKITADGNIRLNFTYKLDTEINLYGNPLNGSCRCILGSSVY